MMVIKKIVEKMKSKLIEPIVSLCIGEMKQKSGNLSYKDTCIGILLVLQTILSTRCSNTTIRPHLTNITFLVDKIGIRTGLTITTERNMSL
jgi:hypothetical protein